MDNFCPVSWPEDPVPKAYNECGKCGLINHKSRMIWGEGNPQAEVIIILDNPGDREDRKTGQPFVCGTRQTLQFAAREAGFKSEDLYITYVLKYKPTKAYPKEETRKICIHHLHNQIENKNPKLIFRLGNIAVQSYFNNDSVTVKELRGKWHAVNGTLVLTGYHPLAVRRRPNLMPMFLEDWGMLSSKFYSYKE